MWETPVEEKPAAENFNNVRFDRFLSLKKSETAVLTHLLDFFQQHGEAPSIRVVYDYFEQANLPEEVALMSEIAGESQYTGASFTQTVEDEVEHQGGLCLISTCKHAIAIATQGVTEGGKTIKGTNEAVAHLFTALRMKPRLDSGGLAADMAKATPALDKIYLDRKTNPLHSYGVMTGYGLIDSSTAGTRKKQLYLHAGYGGHLKSTMILNMLVNAAVDGGWNGIMFSSEMPAADVMMLMIAIHSGNPKFKQHMKPIPAFKLLLGRLSDPEEKSYKIVQDDLLKNSKHGSIRIVDAAEFTTFGSVMQRVIREHSEQEIDICWVDYITRLPLDAKYMRMEITAGRNEVIADAKRFAMSFNQGEGLAMCSAFQVNREGYKKGLDHGGRLDKTSLAQYNAAEKEADIISYIFYGPEEVATHEPKIGLMKSRWGMVPGDPVSVYIDPDSRRIFDLAAGMSVGSVMGGPPTAGNIQTADVEI